MWCISCDFASRTASARHRTGGISTATENVFVYVRHRRLVTFVFERLINIRLLLLLLILVLEGDELCSLRFICTYLTVCPICSWMHSLLEPQSHAVAAEYSSCWWLLYWRMFCEHSSERSSVQESSATGILCHNMWLGTRLGLSLGLGLGFGRGTFATDIFLAFWFL